MCACAAWRAFAADVCLLEAADLDSLITAGRRASTAAQHGFMSTRAKEERTAAALYSAVDDGGDRGGLGFAEFVGALLIVADGERVWDFCERPKYNKYDHLPVHTIDPELYEAAAQYIHELGLTDDFAMFMKAYLDYLVEVETERWCGDILEITGTVSPKEEAGEGKE